LAGCGGWSAERKLYNVLQRIAFAFWFTANGFSNRVASDTAALQCFTSFLPPELPLHDPARPDPSCAVPNKTRRLQFARVPQRGRRETPPVAQTIRLSPG